MDEFQWEEFCNDIDEIYASLKEVNEGDVASYIPQLANVDENMFGISVYSIDNRHHGIGNINHNFCIQSCSKTLTYALALRDNGVEKTNRHIGREPSGARFNAFVFDDENKPFNPLINSGAIMSAALVKSQSSDDIRFEYVVDTWKKIVGKNNVGFDNGVYLSEKNTANRNHALAHIMMENNIFPPRTDINKTLEFYFQLCSITMNCTALSKYGAMLANGGTTVDTNEKIFDPVIARDLLCIMYSSGMYDYSGRWSYDIGLPAKSGVSGAIFAVVPHIGGICVYSPKLDEIGNSVRGVEFFRKLTQKYRLHIFDTLITGLNEKKTLLKLTDSIETQIYDCCKNNKYDLLKKIIESNHIDINKGDYDKRCPLHIAVDENHFKIVDYLINQKACYKKQDRWGNSMYKKMRKKKSKKLGIIFLAHLRKKNVLKTSFNILKQTSNSPNAYHYH